MLKRLGVFILSLVVAITMTPAFTLTADAATVPTTLWVAADEANGLPAQIDGFMVQGGSIWNPTYTYQIYLPGNISEEQLAKCKLSWNEDMQATVDDEIYNSGECPIPPVNAEKTYIFTDANQTSVSLKIITYQGSTKVTPVFIDIDENKGTIKAMDDDPEHKAECSGRINIGNHWYEMSKIKGRGNATWEKAKDKRPYNVTLAKSEDKIKFPGVDSKKTRKWTFLAEVLDHSLMCNRAGFHLAHEMGIGQDTASADVWMNGEYQGCYTVTPKTDSFVTNEGFMIEQDNYQEDPVEEGGDPQFTLDGLITTVSGWSSAYNYITVKAMGDGLLVDEEGGDGTQTPEQKAVAKIRSWLQEAWDAIRSTDGYNHDTNKYYTDYIDIESFAKMYLMHEYVKSFDVCAGSILFYRNGTDDNNDKLIAGPLWDLDNAMGSTCRNNDLGSSAADRKSGEGDFIPVIQEYKTSIYKTISKHADFMKEVKRQYNKYSSEFDSLPEDVEQMKNDIADSARMNHNKVEDLGHGTWDNNHYYSRDTTLGSGQYTQRYLATTDPKTDWGNYAANLETYTSARSLWFKNKYTCTHTGTITEIAAAGATCTEDGNTGYWICEECGKYFSDAEVTTEIEEGSWVIPALGHDIQHHEAVEETCTEPGNDEYWSCDRCSKYFSDENGETEIEEGSWIISAGHKWKSSYTVDKAPTVTATGLKSIHCSVCGKIKPGSSESIPKLDPAGEGAPIATAEKAIMKAATDEGPAGTKFGVLKLRTTKQTRGSISLKWTKVRKAKKYVIYGNRCGKTRKMKKIATVTVNARTFKKVAGKKIRKGRYYKFIIVAVDKNKKVISTSKVVHVATKGGKVGNHKSVTVKKSILTKAQNLRVGKSLKLNARAVKATKLRVSSHRGIVYESTNKKIAGVSKGVLKAKKKGTCYVYAYAQDGVYKKVKVVVK